MLGISREEALFTNSANKELTEKEKKILRPVEREKCEKLKKKN